MPSLSFDSMAALYEATRTVDGASLDSALDFLVERFPPSRFGRVLDPGIGTGRIAIPLAAHGYRVTGVDISGEMLSYLAKRLAEEPRSIAVDFHRGDVTRLAFPDATFDMALVVHLFYFIADWRRAAGEIARTVRPGGAIVLMHTGTGMEVPALNERLHAVLRRARLPHPPGRRGRHAGGPRLLRRPRPHRRTGARALAVDGAHTAR